MARRYSIGPGLGIHNKLFRALSAMGRATVIVTVPGAPTGVTALAGDSQATVSFSAPASNGGGAITAYTVTSSPGGFTGTGASSPIVVSGLNNSTSYTFTVTATNSAGVGPASSASSAVIPNVDPATLFGAATKGVWLDPSDISTLYQDHGAISPVTTAGQSIGYAGDKSGFGNHLIQATAANRPTYATSGAFHVLHDATDYLGKASVSLKNGMDFFIALYRENTGSIVLGQNGNGGSPADYFGVTIAGGTGTSASANVGSAMTYWVNGTQVAGGTATTRDQLHLAIPVGAWSIVEVRDLDLSLWTAMSILGYATLQSATRHGGAILIDAQTNANRTKLRQYLATKVGMTL